jgi:hypothetical protein
MAFNPPPIGWTQIGQSQVAAMLHGPAVRLAGRTWAFGGAQRPLASSADGLDWRAERSNLPFRSRRPLAIHNGALWTSGGYDNPHGSTSEVWTSSDGVTWTEATAAAEWQARDNHCMVSFHNRLWVFGGSRRDGAEFNDVWSSADGANWRQEAQHPFTSSRSLAAAVVFKDRLWCLGGAFAVGNPLREVWSSADGVTWRLDTPPWEARFQANAQVIDDVLYLQGGVTAGSASAFADLWSSADGVTWTCVDNSGPAVSGPGSALIDGAMVLFGGFAGTSHSPAIYRYAPIKPG